jgi:tRNA A-37 threonylcarbamoyl transferase component Bud32
MPFPDSSIAESRRFTQIHSIGKGAAGQVYAARDNLGRMVAVKELLPSHRSFQQLRERFETEARIQAALSSPSIIAVYHLDEDPQTHELYLVTEYAGGGSLADYLQAHGPLAERQALNVALDMCVALEVTSAHGIVHRDLKPSNMLVFNDAHGQIACVKLGDFGVARDLGRRPTTVIAGYHHPGTPEYMAPEQADISRPVDVRTDIYALGVSLWELLTGKDYKPLCAQSGTPDLRAFCPGCSEDTGMLVERATQADPALRYQTPQELARDLRDLLHGRRLAARQTITVGAQKLPQFTASRQAAPPVFTRRPRPLGARLLPVALVIAALIGVFVLLGPMGAGQGQARQPLGVAAGAGSPNTLSADGLPCRFNNLLACSTLVPVFVPGESEAAATTYDSGRVLVAFRNQQKGSGLALQFSPELDVSGFTHLQLIGSSDAPFSFGVEYKQGVGLEIVKRSPNRQFPSGTQVIDLPITYDGRIDELVLVFPTAGEATRLTIEALRLR